MNKHYATKLAFKLAEKLIDSGGMTCKVGSTDANSLVDFCEALIARLEKMDLPDETAHRL